MAARLCSLILPLEGRAVDYLGGHGRSVGEGHGVCVLPPHLWASAASVGFRGLTASAPAGDEETTAKPERLHALMADGRSRDPGQDPY